MCGFPMPAVQDPQHRVRVGGGADRRAGVGAHPLLVDDDRGRQPLERVDVRTRQRRHEALQEGAVGLVDQPLRVRGDRVEDQRALAGAGHAGERRQPPLGKLDADVLEVVLTGTVHADQVVAVGSVRRRMCRLRRLGGRLASAVLLAVLLAVLMCLLWCGGRRRGRGTPSSVYRICLPDRVRTGRQTDRARVDAVSHANPSGSVKGSASLPMTIRCDPVPSAETPASLARARRP